MVLGQHKVQRFLCPGYAYVQQAVDVVGILGVFGGKLWREVRDQ
jgi:hypothetical protein